MFEKLKNGNFEIILIQLFKHLSGNEDEIKKNYAQYMKNHIEEFKNFEDSEKANEAPIKISSFYNSERDYLNDLLKFYPSIFFKGILSN